MPIMERVQEDMKEAMKQRQAERLSVLRMLNTSLKNEAINQRTDAVSDEDAMKVIKSEVKKRKDSIQAYEEGARQDLAEQEKKELTILEEYLPEQMSEEELKSKIDNVLSGLSDDEKDNFGKVMGAVMKEIGPVADGNTVRAILLDKLSK